MSNKLTTGQKALLDLIEQDGLYLVYDRISAAAWLQQGGEKCGKVTFKAFLAVRDYLQEVESPRYHLKFYKAK